jgi:hypothetical protein
LPDMTQIWDKNALPNSRLARLPATSALVTIGWWSSK